MELYAIETETHSEKKITHFVTHGQQLEGMRGAWLSSCGRVVRGTVWHAGTVEGGRCKPCATEQIRLQKLEEKRTQLKKGNK